jgi:PKD repeat protein
MDGKNKKFKSFLLSFTLIASLLVFGLASVPTAQAHIVIIGSPYSSDSPLPADYLTDAKEIAAALKAKGYTGNKLVELYGKQATSANILKAMYNADAVIYIGHGGYQSGHYNGNGGTATPPFSLVGSDLSTGTSGNEFIWGIGDQMRQGWSGQLFTAPLKSNSMAFLFHACFSTGDVEGKQVANPVPTIYNFAKMFTGAGASYYASAYYGGDIIKAFLNGATSFTDANNKIGFNGEKITNSYSYNGTTISRSTDKSVAFTGNWNYVFPSASQISAYNSIAADAWYNGDKTKLLVSAFTAAQNNYVATKITFTEFSCDVKDTIVKYIWDFGDGNFVETNNTLNIVHDFGSFGNYVVKHTVINSKNQTSTASKSISVQDRAPVVGFTVSPANPSVWAKTNFYSTSYDPDFNDSINSLYWNFGDGAKATGSSANHSFSKEGYYKVSLTAKDTYGKSATNYKTIKVGNPKPDLYIVSIKKSNSNRYIKIKNKGTATSKGVYLRIWPGKSSKKHYRQVYVKSLKPGYSTTVKITKYYYKHGKAKVDYTNRVSEKSETNNIRIF